MARVGILLSGCGTFDGSDIYETVLALLALTRAGASVMCTAPDMAQHHVLNHLNQEEMAGQRNVLEEAARIFRGDIVPLTAVDARLLDALILPGGFGTVKNLCRFAFKGPSKEVDPGFRDLLTRLQTDQKPIGAIGLAVIPLVIALAKNQPEIAVGGDRAAAATIDQIGGRPHLCQSGQVWVDRTNKIVTMPPFSPKAKVDTIADGIGQLIKRVLDMILK